MKKAVLFFVLIVFSIPSINAQFFCDFEDCSQGYSECNGNPIICSSGLNHTPGGDYSIYIPGDGTDVMLDLGNQTSGIWGLEFWMYIPSGKEGYFNIQGQVPVGSGEWVVGNIFFNQDLASPGAGCIDWGDHDPANDTCFDFPHDQWFQIVINVDISMGISEATWEFGVDGVVAVPAGTPFHDIYDSPVTSLGGIDFFSISSDNEYWVDDILFQESFVIISTNDLISKQYSSYPNPVNNELHISANEIISNVSIYNMLGQEIYTKDIDEMDCVIDTSNLTNGTYFATVTIGNTIEKLKIVKL